MLVERPQASLCARASYASGVAISPDGKVILVAGVRGFNVSTRARGGRASAHPLARGKPLPDASLPVTCA